MAETERVVGTRVLARCIECTCPIGPPPVRHYNELQNAMLKTRIDRVTENIDHATRILLMRALKMGANQRRACFLCISRSKCVWRFSARVASGSISGATWIPDDCALYTSQCELLNRINFFQKITDTARDSHVGIHSILMFTTAGCLGVGACLVAKKTTNAVRGRLVFYSIL